LSDAAVDIQPAEHANQQQRKQRYDDGVHV
jgi:hypothetical protein